MSKRVFRHTDGREEPWPLVDPEPGRTYEGSVVTRVGTHVRIALTVKGGDLTLSGDVTTQVLHDGDTYMMMVPREIEPHLTVTTVKPELRADDDRPTREDIDLAKLMVEVASAKGKTVDEAYQALAAATPAKPDHRVIGVAWTPVCSHCWEAVAQNDDEKWEHVT